MKNFASPLSFFVTTALFIAAKTSTSTFVDARKNAGSATLHHGLVRHRTRALSTNTNSEKPDEPGTSDAPEYSSLEELSWNTSVAAMDTINKGTAASITSLVLMLIQRGMDKRQIMGVLHAQGYTSKDLETIFDGHDQENMELNQAFGTVIVPLQNMNNETRHLSITVPLKEGDQEATGNNNEEMQTIPKFMEASSLEEEPGRHRNALAPGELEARIAQLQEEAEARFSAGPHRSLQSACNAILNLGVGNEVAEAYKDFTENEDLQSFADLFDLASSIGEKRLIARAIQNLPSSRIVSCIADALDTTITFSSSFDATVLFFNADFGLNLIFGDDGQFALAETTGYGFDLGLVGVGVAVGVSVSVRHIHGGFATISSRLNDPDVCFAVGYTPFLVGGAITFSISPNSVANDRESDVVDSITDIVEKGHNDRIDVGDLLESLVSLLGALNGGFVTSVGIEATIGADVLDFRGAKLILPDLSIHACSEELLFCEGTGCEGKLMIDSWDDGDLCGLGTTCNYCENKATYW